MKNKPSPFNTAREKSDSASKRFITALMIVSLVIVPVMAFAADDCYVTISWSYCVRNGDCLSDCSEQACPPLLTPYKLGVFSLEDVVHGEGVTGGECGSSSYVHTYIKTIQAVQRVWDGCQYWPPYHEQTGTIDIHCEDIHSGAFDCNTGGCGLAMLDTSPSEIGEPIAISQEFLSYAPIER